jgi:signal transduction histidine kinase
VTWIEEDHSFNLPPKVVEYLDLIKDRIKRAENLLKGILMYAHIGKENRIREVVDVNELVVEIFDDLPKKEGIELMVKSDMPTLYTERIPLRQVFTNLISNALKYHDKSTGSVIVYHTVVNNGYLKFFVKDDGPGIDPTYHEKIFVIFQTLGERDSLESTGVGLAIVKKILDDRNLEIEVVSKVGQGSIFSFTWPKNEYDEKSD